MTEVNLIIHVISAGAIILLVCVIFRLIKKINKMYDRVTAVDDYILSKFLLNERYKEDNTRESARRTDIGDSSQ